MPGAVRWCEIMASQKVLAPVEINFWKPRGDLYDFFTGKVLFQKHPKTNLSIFLGVGKPGTCRRETYGNVASYTKPMGLSLE